jgi:hypothetical protein
MTIARCTAYLSLAGAAAAFRASAAEVYYWPAYVEWRDAAGSTVSWSAAGPFLFSAPLPAPAPGRASGFRPFYVKITDPDSEKTDILYPLFFHRKYPGAYKWSILNLINGEGITSRVTEAGGPKDHHFDVWPFYFSHETDSPDDTYHALLPVYGTIKYRLTFTKLFWAPFPLFVQTDKDDTHVTYVPWPIVRFISGAEKGFAIWPLFGVNRGPDVARHKFFLWPLIWDNTILPGPDAPEGTAPGTEVGFLPFYSREKSPGSENVNFGWPFFGYTVRTVPDQYSEKRYFWPFIVQGTGVDKHVNRWGPIFTHSVSKGIDSEWIGWPFWHRRKWVDGDIAETQTQFFYFVYWSVDEASVSRPALAHAYKRHYWPLVSIWDNGAGSRQIEVPSLFEVFFPDNPDMRVVWTPLLSFYRYSHRPTGEARSSLLWDAVTWRRNAAGALAELRLGPFLSMRRNPAGPALSILGFDFGAKSGEGRLANR